MYFNIKLFSTILLFLISFQSFGTYPLFEFRLYQIKKLIKTKIKKGVPKNELFEIVDSDKIIWKESHEFTINGHYFDIVESKTINDKQIYLCISDEQETKLFKDLDNKTRKTAKNDNYLKLLSTFFLLNYLSEKKEIKFQSTLTETLRKPIFFSLKILQNYFEIDTPPPQIN